MAATMPRTSATPPADGMEDRSAKIYPRTSAHHHKGVRTALKSPGTATNILNTSGKHPQENDRKFQDIPQKTSIHPAESFKNPAGSFKPPAESFRAFHGKEILSHARAHTRGRDIPSLLRQKKSVKRRGQPLTSVNLHFFLSSYKCIYKG